MKRIHLVTIIQTGIPDQLRRVNNGFYNILTNTVPIFFRYWIRWDIPWCGITIRPILSYHILQVDNTCEETSQYQYSQSVHIHNEIIKFITWTANNGTLIKFLNLFLEHSPCHHFHGRYHNQTPPVLHPFPKVCLQQFHVSTSEASEMYTKIYIMTSFSEMA